MEEVIKHINDTNASYRSPNAGDAKNTDLFLDNDHYDYFKESGDKVFVRFQKENLSKAILFIASILTRKNDKTDKHKSVSYSSKFVYEQLALLDGYFMENGIAVESKTQIWNARKDVLQRNGKIDNRFYFNGLIEDFTYLDSDGNSQKAKFTLRNYLAGGYSDVHFKKANDGIFDVTVTNVQEAYYDDKENGLEEIDNKPSLDLPLQQIYFGAPGTGKSFSIDLETEKMPKDSVFRTTFHPDSDYSTFVGAYKPTMRMLRKRISYDLSINELAETLKEYYDSHQGGNIAGIQQFVYDYLPYFNGEISSVNTKKMLTLAGLSESYAGEINNKYVKILSLVPNIEESKIEYSFVKQTFLKAYLKAWEDTTKKVALVIEEINRGNCAQIFGDLFQLLDRKKGFSDYPIDADEDLHKTLQSEFTRFTKPNAEICKKVNELYAKHYSNAIDKIWNGEILVLPDNLHIWATMNTSDQSLFPIDSAFKRRWDWKYMKIKNHPEEGYSIKIGESETDWWEFIQKINEIIASMTSSADKQLGYFFCKAKDGKIDEETFVSKVIFYLWNDVFKDYGFEDASLFRYTNKDGIEKDLTFPDFFDENGDKVDNERLADFVNKVMNWKRMES